MSEHHHERDEAPQADPTGTDEPHDVLAAEEFGIGTRDERYPADPTGIHEPHDVLAAEEFAMPAPEAGEAAPGRGSLLAWVPAAIALAVALVLLRRRRS
jgi:hypothetical protein